MNVTSQSPVHLLSGMQSEAIDNEDDVDASLLDDVDVDVENAAPIGDSRGFVRPSGIGRRRLAEDARSPSRAALHSLALRAAENEEATTASAHENKHFDAEGVRPVRPAKPLLTSSRERFERLVEQVQARPQIAIGVAAAAAIMVTTLVWSKTGRLLLLAGGGYAADRIYGHRVRRTVKRLARRLPLAPQLKR